MSEQERFLRRWSRRKQKAAELAKEFAAQEPAPEKAETLAADKHVDEAVSPAEPKRETAEDFDVESLPPIDSIGATTDIRRFLAPGVPAELKRAALQKVWRTDPAIRDFVGLSENSWDFNDPAGMHGFGPLQLTDELKQIVAQMFTPSRTSDSDHSDQNDKVKGPAKIAEVSAPKNAADGKNNSVSGISAVPQASQEDAAMQEKADLQQQNDLQPKHEDDDASQRK